MKKESNLYGEIVELDLCLSNLMEEAARDGGLKGSDRKLKRTLEKQLKDTKFDYDELDREIGGVESKRKKTQR